jgi:predicted transcriptional regulator of viral defense system
MNAGRKIIGKFSQYPAFTYKEVEFYTGRSVPDLARVLSYMKKTGRIYTIRKGVYTTTKDSMLSGFAYTPFYYGMLSAMTIRGLWTQESRPDIITIRKVRNSRKAVFGDRTDVVFVHHIPARYFFGYDIVKYGRFMLPVSDAEKTLIDLFYYRVRLAVQNYGNLLAAVRQRKLKEYLMTYDAHTVSSVTNFVKRYKRAADSGRLTSEY